MVLDVDRLSGRRFLRLSLLLTILGVLLLTACGDAYEAVDSSNSTGVLSSSTGPESATTSPVTSGSPADTSATASATPRPSAAWRAPAAEVRRLFEQLGKEALGFDLLVPSELPEGTRLAPAWRPLDAESGALSQTNPRLTGEAGAKELRLLLQTDAGWLEIIEGLRGDLGELPSERVTLREGVSGGIYRVMGGTVVQWSQGDSPYAVFGQGVAAEDVLRVAQGMELLNGG